MSENGAASTFSGRPGDLREFVPQAIRSVNNCLIQLAEIENEIVTSPAPDSLDILLETGISQYRSDIMDRFHKLHSIQHDIGVRPSSRAGSESVVVTELVSIIKSLLDQLYTWDERIENAFTLWELTEYRAEMQVVHDYLVAALEWR